MAKLYQADLEVDSPLQKPQISGNSVEASR